MSSVSSSFFRAGSSQNRAGSSQNRFWPKSRGIVSGMKRLILSIAILVSVSGCSWMTPDWYGLTRNDLELVKAEYVRARGIVVAARDSIPPEDWESLKQFDGQLIVLYESAMESIDRGDPEKIRLSISTFLSVFDMAQPLIGSYLNDRRAHRLKAFANILRIWSETR